MRLGDLLRTKSERMAYVDGYNACFNLFCECLPDNKAVHKAVKKMEVYLEAVNSTVSREEGGADDRT